eukprot:sb/3478287/
MVPTLHLDASRDGPQEEEEDSPAIIPVSRFPSLVPLHLVQCSVRVLAVPLTENHPPWLGPFSAPIRAVQPVKQHTADQDRVHGRKDDKRFTITASSGIGLNK